ncbi:nucleotidyltransferase family protein [Murimonas intestini]|uniref:nucleotidyltransferase family protein n=1 Tax=Murimonas intestini TaxID=1337051 RepID=UPI0011DCD71E|nr:nucleotidyltransferase family protein [Murimonas intestini]
MKVTLIYLAAGNSRRFGLNKLLYPIEGRAMYRHLLERLASICERHEGWEVLAVTQYEEIYSEIMSSMEGRPVRVIMSPDSIRGISMSVKAGVRASGDSDAWAFFVADQPFMKETTAEGFLETMEREGCELGCMASGGHLGNPAWFLAEYAPELLDLAGDRGGKQIIRKYLERVRLYEAGGEKELLDIDTMSGLL